MKPEFSDIIAVLLVFAIRIGCVVWILWMLESWTWLPFLPSNWSFFPWPL